ncbi:MAG: SDR family NAD(P)-dependent oxidoreductase [Myxococcota bacterium]|nr:SDR family NAD(P)-dependent oxidoreductase [Myxococcota bacterium]
MDLEGKVAIVTGAARGIGRGIAVGLAEAGADVALADLASGGDEMTYPMAGRAELEAAAKEVEQRGRRALAIGCDVTRADQVDALVATTREAFGRVDVLVNNAGVVHFQPLVEFDEARWDRLFDVNVKGVFLACRAAIPSLVETAGCIVNIASVAGKTGHPFGTGYCASKFAVVGLTQSLAAELGGQGVRVNAVCPGILATHMWTHHLASEERGGADAYAAAVAAVIPMGREQSAEDIAQAVLYLATAPNVTGVALNVAGGMEMH